MSTHNLCFRAKIRKICIPNKPKFYYIKVGWGVRGYTFHGHVFLMLNKITESAQLEKFTRDMSRLVGKPTMWFPNRSDTNRAVQA